LRCGDQKTSAFLNGGHSMKNVLVPVGVVTIVGFFAGQLPFAIETTETEALIVTVLAAAICSILALLLAAIYLLPTLVAISQRAHNAFNIALLNIFLGWTIIGWAAALIWSLVDTTNSQQNPAILSVAKAPPPADVQLTSSADAHKSNNSSL